MPEFPRLFPERDEREVQARANKRPMTDFVKLADEKSNCYEHLWKELFACACSILEALLLIILDHCSGDSTQAVLQLGSLL